jgi:Na+-driven multidrug efflux pump
MNILGVSENTLPYTRTYVLLVVVFGNLPAILGNTLGSFLRNCCYSNMASIGMSGGGILNIFLDPLFMFVIFPKGQEVTGAAAATLVSNICSCCFLLIVVIRVSKKAPLSLSFKDFRTVKGEHKREAVKMGIPAAVLPGLFDIAVIILNSLMAAYGDIQVAAIGIVMKIERLPNAINIGISQAVMPLVAYNYASGDRKRMRDIVRTSRITGLVIAVVCVLLINIFDAPLCGIFMNTFGGAAETSVATLIIAENFVRFRCLAPPPQFLNYHTSFCIQAIGNAKATLIHGLLRILVFHIPLLFILNGFFAENGLCLTLFISESMGAVLALILWYRAQRR